MFEPQSANTQISTKYAPILGTDATIDKLDQKMPIPLFDPAIHLSSNLLPNATLSTSSGCLFNRASRTSVTQNRSNSSPKKVSVCFDDKSSAGQFSTGICILGNEHYASSLDARAKMKKWTSSTRLCRIRVTDISLQTPNFVKQAMTHLVA